MDLCIRKGHFNGLEFIFLDGVGVGLFLRNSDINGGNACYMIV